jgi:PAS domain S-box-containing protein
MKGKVSEDTLAILLDALPFEFSFVDSDDRVQLFNKNGDRIFPRSESVIGLKVQNCHPHKSVDKVEKILEEMKAGEREHADFWINLKDKKIQIRYFAVRDPEGKYLGCLEVSQDITEIQKLEGEKRLLD